MQTRTLQLALALLLLLPSGSAHAEDCEFDGETIQLILETGAAIEDVESNYGMVVVDELHPSYLLDLPDGLLPEQAVVLLSTDPLVREVELAYRSETPEGIGQMMVGAVGGSLAEFVDQSIGDRIRLEGAHAHTTGAGVLVAIVDTGVKADHEALTASVDPNGYDFVDNDDDPDDAATGFDEDGDGLVDDAAGHGTMVAGLVLLTAPDATVLPVRVLDDEGRGLTFQVAKGIRYAVDQGADVINLSLGLSCESAIIGQELETAAAAGIHLVAAAGNDGSDDPPFFPASDPRVLSVAALDSLDVRADFSSYHPTVALSAPGVGVYGPFHDGAYAIGAGTSFAAPFVSGQVALIRSADPALSREEVEAVSRAGVAEIYDIAGNEAYEGKLGSGRVDALTTWEETLLLSSLDFGSGARAVRLLATPNPANVGTFVRFRPTDSTLDSPARLLVVDVHGRIVRELRGPEVLGWDGHTSHGRTAAAGAYWVVEPGAPSLSRSLRITLVQD